MVIGIKSRIKQKIVEDSCLKVQEVLNSLCMDNLYYGYIV